LNIYDSELGNAVSAAAPVTAVEATAIFVRILNAVPAGAAPRPPSKFILRSAAVGGHALLIGGAAPLRRGAATAQHTAV
jgi:hypothetical protein